MNERERELLVELKSWLDDTDHGRKGWVTPMQVGGRDSSHHSATLRTLVGRGLVEVRQTGGTVIATGRDAFAQTKPRHMIRGSRRYRITKAGIEALTAPV